MEKSSLKKIVAVKKTKVNTLVPYKSSSDEDTTEQERPAAMKNGVQKVVSNEERTSSKSFLMWENNANVCWLDASMALVVHNQTLINSLAEDSTSQIARIVKFYYEAVSILNNCSDERQIEVRVQLAKDLLKNVQESVLKYLQPILKYKEGEPDSAFCALNNLITEDKSMKAYFEVEFTWFQSCKECSSHRLSRVHKKPIVTLSKVIHFQAHCPVAIYQCPNPKCKEPNQKMTLNFRTLPQCLLFHFESGAGVGELKFNDFEIDGRIYRLTGVMTLEKAKESLVNHFITFVRDADSDTWLECNDLNDEIMCFCMVPPILELEDIYILMYEANDNRGTVTNRSLSADKRGLGEESVGGSADIPLIDLADDTENETSDNGRRCNQPREVAKKYRNAAGLEVSEDDLNNEPSNLEPLLQSDRGVVVLGVKQELGVFSEEMVALSLQEKAVLTQSSSPAIANGTGVLSEINTGEVFVPSDISNKDPVLTPVSSHSSYANQGHFQIESITFAENTGKPSSKTLINGNCLDSTAKQGISKINNAVGNAYPKIKELKEADESQNALPTLTEVNDSSKLAAPESGKSKGQTINQSYKQLLHTLNASLKNPITPLHINPEDGKENVAGDLPVSKENTESANVGQVSEINETQFLPMHSSKHNDLEMLCSDLDLITPGTKAAQQNNFDEKITEALRYQKNLENTHLENSAHNCDLNSVETDMKPQVNSEFKTTTSQGLQENVKNTNTMNIAHNFDLNSSESQKNPVNSDVKMTTSQGLQKSVKHTHPENIAHNCDLNSSELDNKPQVNSEAKTTTSQKLQKNTHLENVAHNCDPSETNGEYVNNAITKYTEESYLQDTVENIHSVTTNQTGELLKDNTSEHQHDKQNPINLNSQIVLIEFEEKPASSVYENGTCNLNVETHEKTLRPRLQTKECSKVQKGESKSNGVGEAENIASHLDERNRKIKLRPRLPSKDCSEVQNEKETTSTSEETTRKRLRPRLQSNDCSKVHDEEPKASVVSVSKNSTSHSDSITCERKLRTRSQSKDSPEDHNTEGLKCASHKRQTKLVHEKSNSDVLKKSVSSDGDTIVEESSCLNTRRRRSKDNTVITSETKQNTNLGKGLPIKRSRCSSVCESTNETQNPVSADTNSVPFDKRVTRSRTLSSEVLCDTKVSIVNTDTPMSLYKNDSSTKSSTVEAMVDTCNIVERKVKKKRTNSKSPEVLHNLEDKSINLKPKRCRARSSELCDDERKHSEKVDSKFPEILHISKERSFSQKPKRHRAKSTMLFDVTEHFEIINSKSPEVLLHTSKGKSVIPKPRKRQAKMAEDKKKHYNNGDSDFLKTLQNLTEKTESLKPKRYSAKPFKFLDDGMKISENTETQKKLSLKKNLKLLRRKSTNKDISDVTGDPNMFLDPCNNSGVEADGPNNQNINSNLNGLLDHKSDCNQNAHVNFSNASVKLKEKDNKTKNLENNVNIKACSCDCIPQDMDELIDIGVDSVLLSIFRGFDIRRRT
ncbi:hypothetical protein JTE90_016193 [Oedothorax gibbosus]|uniref:USP domain-containing protein n=1 Tax=Oedothorax gibbosus TaxID=931172 RepID=A0AAV6U891_9ARAC|nr:hypothetical protein JTE90_016193 [Oedothorax gibbosus]